MHFAAVLKLQMTTKQQCFVYVSSINRFCVAEIIRRTTNGNGLLFHMTQPISRSTIKAIACSKPTISEH